MTEQDFWQTFKLLPNNWQWQTLYRRKHGFGPEMETYIGLRNEDRECPITAVANYIKKEKTFTTNNPIDAINYLSLPMPWAGVLVEAADNNTFTKQHKTIIKTLKKISK